MGGIEDDLFDDADGGFDLFQLNASHKWSQMAKRLNLWLGLAAQSSEYLCKEEDLFVKTD